MKFLIFPYTVLALLNAFFLKSIETFLTGKGFSWTFSKLFPYVTLVVLGILITIWIKNHLYIQKKPLRVLLMLSGLIVPFLLGFLLNPIYEGDFSKQGTPLSLTKKANAPFRKMQADLVVIAIPGCPYCAGSIEKLKVIQQRHPKMRIRFVVCSSDPKTLQPYKQLVEKAFPVQLSEDLESLPKVSEFSFPTFVQVKNGKAVYRWHNDQFGVRAIDQLEKGF